MSEECLMYWIRKKKKYSYRVDSAMKKKYSVKYDLPPMPSKSLKKSAKYRRLYRKNRFDFDDMGDLYAVASFRRKKHSEN